jgi:hypothetical protein
MIKTRLWKGASASLLAAAGLAVVPTAVASAASATSTPSFTTVTTSANPVLVGVNFTVSGQECNRVADNPPSGNLVFKDVTTGVTLGTVALSPDTTFVNCSDASVKDTETLSAGKYKIKASYKPSGSTQAAPSSASYKQKVQNPAFTDITWTEGAAVPNAHEEGAAVPLDGAVYDISGSTDDCSDGGCGQIQPAVDVYHPASNTFTSAAPIPNPRTEDPAAVVVGGDIYVLGGVDIGGATVSAIDVYNPTTGWSTLPSSSDLPSGYSGSWACAAESGSDIYYFDPATHTIGTFDTLTGSWTVSAAQPLLSPSLFCSAATDGSNIVIVGAGDGGNGPSSQRVLIFTPSSGTLSLGQGTTVPTAEQSAADLDGTVVVAGGDFNFNAVEGVAPGQGSVTTYSNLPDNRDDAAGGSVVNGKFYIVGGQSTTTTTPDVLIGTPN